MYNLAGVWKYSWHTSRQGNIEENIVNVMMEDCYDTCLITIIGLEKMASIARFLLFFYLLNTYMGAGAVSG